MERGDRGFGAGSYSSSGTSDAEDEELKPPGGSSFPSELGSPYQRVCGPRTPESQKRHADAGEKLVRLASQFPHVQGESAADVPSSNVPVFGNIGGVPNAEVRGNSPHDLMRATPSAVGSEMIPPAEEGQAATQLSTVYQSMPSTPVPDAAGDTVFIFDWDDTLFPTWFVSEVVMPCLPPDAKSDSTLPVDSPFAEALAKHARTVRSLLSSARGIGRVGIVTLAQRPWVLSSAQRFLPGIDFKLVLKELDIPIIYARECLRRPMISQAKIEEGVNVFTVAKQAAMLKALKKLYGKKAWTNVISIGDSIVERDAITELLWSHGQDSERMSCCKTVKLMDEPSAEQLHAELVLLDRFLRNMAEHAEDFDVVMDDPEEMMCQFNARFGS